MASGKSTILVHAAVGQQPLAGVAWQALHYVLGLRRLGYDVWYIEDSGAEPMDSRGEAVADSAPNVAFVRAMMERFDLGDRWAYWDSEHDAVHGIPVERLRALYGEAAALFNISGATLLRGEHMACPVRVYIDTDPVFQQAMVADGDAATIAALAAHTHHFTYGENLGEPDSPVPMRLFDWRKTRPPVLVDLWDAGCVGAGPFLSSIATWGSIGREYRIGDTTYHRSKYVNLQKFLDLPRQMLQQIRLAVDPPTAEVAERLRQGGWDIVDSVPLSSDMREYRDFIVGSRGEFTVAKDIYVRPRSGWFSDRSVCYLAAGRPVITQDTGFSKTIATGRGLFAFSTLEEIQAATARINADYARESIAAIEIAYEYFDADTVLRKLVADAGV